MNTAFLEDIADSIITQHPKDILHEVTVVLPSRRAGLFLRKHLAKKIKGPFLSPKIITINELVEDIAGEHSTESTILLFELYNCYKEIEKELAEPFENFSKWGQIMLTDFNEIDRYLIDAKSFFRDLKNIQEIEDWSFNKETLSDSQEKYLSFWLKMGVYYHAFYEKSESNKIFSSGRIYRIASQKIELAVQNFKDKSIYIAGFNAISKSEEKIIETLCNSGKALFFSDSDAWYTNNKNHEAGTFIRQLQNKKWFSENKIHQHFENISREIKICGVPGNTLQANVAGQILSTLSEEELNNTVVVLADEQLLLPVINSLPDNVDAANITMGYSLRNTTVFTFISGLFEFQNGIRISKNGNIKFYTPDVLRVLMNAETNALYSKASKISEEIIQSGKTYLSSDDLNDFLKEAETIRNLFIPWENAQKDGLTMISNSLEELHRIHSTKDSVQQEFVFTALQSILQLILLLEKYPFVSETKSVQKLCLQVLKNESVPFYGEPLKGLQILGMLESRALDFKNIIILSTNEDILPKGNNQQSIIPYDLKQYYKLPTYRETDAVFAHHFYRLIQRGENIHLLFNSSGDKLGGGEKSRFILQIEEEFPKAFPKTSIKNVHASFSNVSTNNQETKIKNSSELIIRTKSILENGLSPSAISRFIECPLDFYYQNIIGIREPDFDDAMNDAFFGTIIHQTLEDLYQPHIGKVLVEKDLENMKLVLNEKAKIHFLEVMRNADINSGKNFLGFHVILNYCLKCIDHDISLVKEGELIILELEQTISEKFNVYPYGEEMEICLKGNVDRIDKYNGQTRIIDYKTGKVEDNFLKVTDITKLNKKPKAIQLMIYALIYMKKNKINEAYPMHYGLRLNGNPEIPLIIVRESYLKLDNQEILTDTLTEMVANLLDENFVFEHNSKSKYCDFC